MQRLMLLVTLLASSASTLAAPVLFLDPAEQSVIVGDPFTLDLRIAGLEPGTAVSTFDVEVGFDPALVAYLDLSFGDLLDPLGLGSLRDVVADTDRVGVFELSFDAAADLVAAQPASFVLATLQFTLLGATPASITLTLNTLGDALGDPLVAEVIGAAVAPVPLPAAWPLLSGGMLLLGAATRKQTARSDG
jgi:hypothetical protein